MVSKVVVGAGAFEDDVQDLGNILQTFSTVGMGQQQAASFWRQQDVPFSAYLDSFAATHAAMKEEPCLAAMEADPALFAYTAAGLRCACQAVPASVTSCPWKPVLILQIGHERVGHLCNITVAVLISVG